MFSVMCLYPDMGLAHLIVENSVTVLGCQPLIVDARAARK